VRLYSPTLGIFLQTDPVLGGNSGPYTYVSDPIGMYDLDGKWGWKSFAKAIAVGVAVGFICAGTAGIGCAVMAGAAVGAAIGAAEYGLTARNRSWRGFARATGYGAASGAFNGVGGYSRSVYAYKRGWSFARTGRHAAGGRHRAARPRSYMSWGDVYKSSLGARTWGDAYRIYRRYG
jgi:hypothetical protein